MPKAWNPHRQSIDNAFLTKPEYCLHHMLLTIGLPSNFETSMVCKSTTNSTSQRIKCNVLHEWLNGKQMCCSQLWKFIAPNLIGCTCAGTWTLECSPNISDDTHAKSIELSSTKHTAKELCTSQQLTSSQKLSTETIPYQTWILFTAHAYHNWPSIQLWNINGIEVYNRTSQRSKCNVLPEWANGEQMCCSRLLKFIVPNLIGFELPPRLIQHVELAVAWIWYGSHYKKK